MCNLNNLLDDLRPCMAVDTPKFNDLIRSYFYLRVQYAIDLSRLAGEDFSLASIENFVYEFILKEFRGRIFNNFDEAFDFYKYLGLGRMSEDIA
jgi:hypothetical protein